MSEYIFKLPDLGEGMVEAEIAEWMVKVGDQVQEEDTLCAMLTDKAAVELTAPVGGRVISVAGVEGDMVAVGAALVVFETDAEQTAGPTQAAADPGSPTDGSEESTIKAASAKPATRTEDSPGPIATLSSGKVLTSPSIRSQARELGVDLGQIAGSGPRGRILRADMDAYLANHVPGHDAPTSGSPPSKPLANGITEIKVIGLRRIIAQKMSKAAQEIPHFAYVEEVDISALESLRAHLNSKKSPTDPKLTPLAFIGLALAAVLRDFPQCNAHYDEQNNTILRHQGVHLGIATQTADGLKVPVVRHSEARTLEDLAAEIRRVSAAARDNSATRNELTGSTITITSLGKMGGIVTTPVINQPEVAIIGVNKAVDRPVVVNGQIVIRRMMNLSSSFDHRFVDGYDAAEMIQALKDKLEQPATIFMPG